MQRSAMSEVPSSPSTLTAPAPPPYDTSGHNKDSSEDRTARDLRESFSALLIEQTNVQQLFGTIAARLTHERRIGPGHELCIEWEALRERHRKLHRYSQQSAAQCATFLQTFSTVLVPLSTSSMSHEEKKAMIQRFIESIPVHQDKARQTSASFSQLVADVEVFPARVRSYLARAKSAEASGFWSQIWAGLRAVCQAFWRALLRVIEEVTATFKGMFDRIARIQCSFAGFFVTVDMFGPPEADSRRLNGPESSQDGLERDAQRLAHGLRMFEDSWHLVGLASSMLFDKVDLAGQLTSIPLACDATLRTVERVYEPLCECLRAYSVGKAPKW